MNSLDFQHKLSVVLARSEHHSLSNTIRARLMARLNAQLKKLAVEKESTSSTALSSLANLSSTGYADLRETNALLLHPSQFGLAPPLSSRPEDEKGTRRKPRRRVGEVEELRSFGAGINFDSASSSTSKRKRAARRDREAAEIEETHTPIHNTASSSSTSAVTSSLDQRNIDCGALRRRREELLKQVYFPIYSFDKLFTDKELQMAGHQASLAAIRFFAERPQMHYNDDDDGNSDEDGTEPTGFVASTPYPGGTFDAHDDAAASGGNGSGNGSYNTRSNPPRLVRELESLVFNSVPGLGAAFVNKTGIAPPPPPLRSGEIEADLAAMRSGALAIRASGNENGEHGIKKVRGE